MEERARGKVLCVHGDSRPLPRNVAVGEGGKLTLFDYDESILVNTIPPRRVTPDRMNLYRRVFYPNLLRAQH